MKKTEAAAVQRKTSSKKGWKYAVAIVVALALVTGAIALLRFAGVKLAHKPYDASEPTSLKFAKMVKWIPPGAEFEIAVDVPKALADPALREKLSAVSSGGDSAASDLLGAMLEKQSVIGMLLLTGRLGEVGEEPSVAVIAQGAFDEGVLISAIRAALASGKAGITSEKIGDRTVFVESDARDPFGFIILDKEHMAVGTRSSLEKLFSELAEVAPRTASAVDAVIFGKLFFGPRITALLPQGLSPVSSIEFASTDGMSLAARIACESSDKARDVGMFLEGVRTLLLLQEEGNSALETILKGVAIEIRDGEVTLACKVMPLLDLWGSSK